MDFGGEGGFPGGSAAPMVPEIPGSGGFDNWGPSLSDQAIWATEDDYRAWNGGPNSEIPLNATHDSRSSQSRSGSEPPSKKSRNSQSGDSQGSGSSRSKAIGKMFFKTKLCCKFRAGVCPYITNCNFAHGIEELRRPPPNWQEIVAAHEEERGGVVVEPPREEHQIPTFSSSDLRGESQRSYKGRHCKKFYTDEGCPYGDNCTFLHDEQSRARESVAISLSPTVGGGYGNNGNGSSQKPSNWKTRICNKWETTGSCPFGSKCHFAHGLQELHKYGGGLVEVEGKESSSAAPEPKQGGASLKTTETVVASTPTAPHSDIYHMGLGLPSQRPSGVTQRMGQRPLQKWKGPDKISKIYGDWIDDINE
ncbi:zinc finger CCCH domain-containing protein 56-like [Malania oleifera]|uniref:zinc finger CCCH domain-containing protein 56-like n=1 Tax=Malania oleifera TaxID=397392 RepID=UPI0025AECB42|nr:zinc finger CCCH domain-containing protein 56-like [Malania oleifera]